MKTLRKKDTQYKIKEILHSGSCGVRGTKRTDGRYPLRIGRIVDLDVTKIIGDAPMIINYVCDTDGTSLKGMVLYTSHTLEEATPKEDFLTRKIYKYEKDTHRFLCAI